MLRRRYIKSCNKGFGEKYNMNFGTLDADKRFSRANHDGERERGKPFLVVCYDASVFERPVMMTSTVATIAIIQGRICIVSGRARER
jgi:hypothetical protein